MITVLAGGTGAAKFLTGLVEATTEPVVAIVNTGDDFRLHGLHISPDIDTIRYTLSKDVGPAGWGRSNESWRAMAEMKILADQSPYGSRAGDWFSLGDRDLAVHLYRTQRLSEGATLSQATAELSRSAGLTVDLLPMSDDSAPTMITLADGTDVDFQQYFVGLQHKAAVSNVHLDAARAAAPAPGVIDAIRGARRIVIAPSNPIVSIGPIVAVPAIAAAVRERRNDVIAISPIVGGRAIKGPADHMLEELGHEPSVTGVARMWTEFASALLVDAVDEDSCEAIAATGMTPVVCSTVMLDLAAATALAGVATQAKGN